MNVLCDRTLLAGYAGQKKRIGADLVRRAADELPDTRGRGLRSSGRSRFGGAALRWLAGGALVLMAAAAGFYFDDLRSRLPSEASGPAAPDVASPPPAAAQLVPLDAAGPIAAAPPALGPARGRALNTLLASFAIDGRSSAPSDDDGLLEVLELRGLSLLEVTDARFELLLRLNHPALLSLRADDGTRFLAALLSLDASGGVFYGATERGSLRMDRAEIERRWDGRGYVVWREFESVPPVIGPGSEKGAVVWLQESLAGLGLYAGMPSGRFDQRTAEGVRALQLTRDLEPDGVVGPQTKMVLYDRLDGYAVPRLSGGGGAG